jgi:D-methionine transport system substrate-binding protein
MHCGSTIRSVGAKGRRPLRIAATPVPHAEILDHVRVELVDQGIDLQIEVFESFDEPNDLVAAGRLHGNFFQYLPFLAEFNRRTGAVLVPVVPVHVEPFGLYPAGAGISTVSEIPDYAEVALPSDPVNVARALRMLCDLDLIGCTPGAEHGGVAGVVSNPRQLVFKEVSSWLLGDARQDFDVVFLFGNQAMGLGIDTEGALHCDRGNPTYAEYLVTRPELRDHADIRALAAALNSESTRTFMLDAYVGQVVPAF